MESIRVQKNKVEAHFTSFIKINSKWIIYPNVTSETITPAPMLLRIGPRASTRSTFTVFFI